MSFQCQTSIVCFDTIAAFIEGIKMGTGDLIVTNRYTFHQTYVEGRNVPVLWQEDYGAGEPTETMVSAMLADMPDCRRIIAIGGGTVLDIAKIMALDIGNDEVYPLFSGKVQPTRSRELILVPTTCGTGSEVTNVSVVSFPEKGIKLGLANPALFADKAVLVPEFLQTLPFRPFAYSALDALVHAIESYLSPRHDALTALFSQEAIRILLEGFRQIAEQGENARFGMLSQFQIAACQAGIAFGNAGCGTVHAMSYPVGSTFHVAHGEVNYALLLPVLRYYGTLDNLPRFHDFKKMLSEQLSCAESECLNALEGLLERVIPRKELKAYGMEQEQIARFSQSVLEKQQRLLNNSPIPVTGEMICSIYERAF